MSIDHVALSAVYFKLNRSKLSIDSFETWYDRRPIGQCNQFTTIAKDSSSSLANINYQNTNFNPNVWIRNVALSFVYFELKRSHLSIDSFEP